ncbi:Lrp/AsnC family transcriptional regulator [Endozoicomonas ascidiicola]|uniref:Lrp/AsnC family transcriptional regulator n=1 Tax=Endozoicomonas ascidiicola TaxID=1698521 RepID=UPI00082B380F|nr:Lrp/AsnC family transcriptional regulator [Endozoicomonas ascidiicola]
MKLDRIDRNILTLLQENNRIPNIELAEEVGLSPPACLKRVKQLRDSGVISQDVSLVNPELSDNKMTMLVSVEMERDRKDIYKQFQAAIRNASEVTQCYQTTGNYDFILIVCVRDILAFEHFIDRVLRSNSNIRKFQSSLSIRRIKYSTAINIEPCET